MGVTDSAELAFDDWLGSAQFAPGADRGEGPDRHGYAWAQGFVGFAAGEMRGWLHDKGVRWFPLVQWAERGGYPVRSGADGSAARAHGNSVPRFHVTGALARASSSRSSAPPWTRARGPRDVRFRHRVTSLVVTDGAVTGVRAEVLAPSDAGRGVPSSRDVVGEVEIAAGAVVVTSGGIGANHELVRSRWPQTARPLRRMLSGVPDSTDGLMIGVAADAGAALVHEDRMWHYPEGIANHSPVWTDHGIRVFPGPSSPGSPPTATGCPPRCSPASTPSARSSTSRSAATTTPGSCSTRRSWSRSSRCPARSRTPTSREDVRLLAQRALPGAVGPVARFAEQSPEFAGGHPEELSARMNALVEATPGSRGHVDPAALARVVRLRDKQVRTGLGRTRRSSRRRWRAATASTGYPRVAAAVPTTPKDGPLLAVRLSVLTRKTLGGLWTDTSARVLRADGRAARALAAGEAAGFGGGGVHGHRALEGTFLGGCLYSGRVAGRAVAADLG